MSEHTTHQRIVDYLIAKGEDSWDVGFQATKILRKVKGSRISISDDSGGRIWIDCENGHSYVWNGAAFDQVD